MDITRIAKWSGSGDTGCPSVYTTEDPETLVIQGNVLDEDTRRRLAQVLPGEDAVSIPRETILRAAALLKQGEL